MLATFLALRTDVEVLGMFGSVREFVEHLGRIEFDLLVTDYHLPDGTGLDAVRAARRRQPELHTVLFSGDAAAHEVAAAGEIDEFVLKGCQLTELMAAFHQAAERCRGGAAVA